jgi:hypothetical protein
MRFVGVLRKLFEAASLQAFKLAPPQKFGEARAFESLQQKPTLTFF